MSNREPPVSTRDLPGVAAGGQPSSPSASRPLRGPARRPVGTAVVVGPGPVLGDTGLPAGLAPILGRSPLQRHLIHLAETGIERCMILLEHGPAGEGIVQACRRQAADVPTGDMLVVVHRAEADDVTRPDDVTWLGEDAITSAGEEVGSVLWLRVEGVYDPRLYRRLQGEQVPTGLYDRLGDGAGRDEAGLRFVGMATLTVPGSPRAAGLREAEGPTGPPRGMEDPDGGSGRLLVDELPTYVPALRRHLRPYWVLVHSEEDRRRAARRILDSAQKGVLDFPARFLHPLPENLFTRWLTATPVTPNQVTVATGIIGFAATYLFATGSFGWALAIAVLVNILDGVDGKLARVELRTSRFGDRLDHVLDVAFEFSWYLALGWGLRGATGDPLPLQLGAGLVGVMTAARVVSGVYRRLTGRQIHDHRAFDRAFRLVAGRRNTYVVALVVGLGVGGLEEAFYACFAWGATTLLVYAGRSLYALASRAGPLLRSFSGRAP